MAGTEAGRQSTLEDDQRLLDEAFAGGDAADIAEALGAIARARGMSVIARDAGVSRVALYKALSRGGDPRLTTLLGVLRALGITISATLVPAPADAPSEPPAR